MKSGGHKHSVHLAPSSTPAPSAYCRLPLGATSRGHEMAATVPGITSSHNSVQNRKGAKELFLLSERKILTMKHASTHYTLWRVLFIVTLSCATCPLKTSEWQRTHVMITVDRLRFIFQLSPGKCAAQSKEVASVWGEKRQEDRRWQCCFMSLDSLPVSCGVGRATFHSPQGLIVPGHLGKQGSERPRNVLNITQ